MSKRNYRKEYDNYHAKPEQRKRRSERNKSRREAKRRGMDVEGKDVHHRDGNPANRSRGNMRAVSKSSNRSFPRTSKGRVKKR